MQVRNIAKTIKESIVPDTLGVKAKKWDQKVLLEDGKRSQTQIKQTLLDIRLGLKNEKITTLKDNSNYVGTDTRDVYYDHWNVSV